jgi:hypothetical protein
MCSMDAVVIFSAAASASPTAHASDTWEGRPVDVYSVDSTTTGAPLPDTGMSLLPFSVTSIKGIFWIDQATSIAHGQGLLQITVTLP